MATHKGNPKAASFRIESDTEAGYIGQRRHDLRIGHQPKYVDPNRIHLNRVLIEPPAPSVVRKIAADHRSRRDTKRAMKSNAAISTAGIITFGSEAALMFEAIPPDQQDRALKLLARSAAMRLRTPLLGLVLHGDEATIHAHTTYSAYTRDGVPVSKATRPSDMSAMQDLTARIMQRFCPGIERGNRYGDRLAAGADWSDVIHKSVAELHRTLPADLAVKRQALADLAQAETDAAARVDEMRGRVEKLTAKAELTDKEVKRLQTYEKRLADRVGDLEAAQTASEAARAEADRLAAQAHVDRQEQEAKAEKIAAKVNAVTDAVASLNDEISAGTIRRDPHGKIKTASPDRLKPAYPEIQPAVRAAADLVTGMDAARSEIASDKKELEDGRRDLLDGQMQLMTAAAEIQSLRQKLKHALSMVVGWLRRPELADDMRQEGEELLRGAKPLLSTEDPGEDTGPGF
jgi:hypothetical protein